jgi:hypothetical protein
VILTEFETKMEGAFKFFEYLKVGAKTVYSFCDKKKGKRYNLVYSKQKNYCVIIIS